MPSSRISLEEIGVAQNGLHMNLYEIPIVFLTIILFPFTGPFLKHMGQGLDLHG